MTTFNWIIAALDCAPAEDGHNNVVKVVHWRCEGSDGTVGGSTYGACSLPAPEGAFGAYDSLTPETVLGWIWANGVDKDATEAIVQSQIDTAKRPSIVQRPLPPGFLKNEVN